MSALNAADRAERAFTLLARAEIAFAAAESKLDSADLSYRRMKTKLDAAIKAWEEAQAAQEEEEGLND